MLCCFGLGAGWGGVYRLIGPPPNPKSSRAPQRGGYLPQGGLGLVVGGGTWGWRSLAPGWGPLVGGELGCGACVWAVQLGATAPVDLGGAFCPAFTLRPPGRHRCLGALWGRDVGPLLILGPCGGHIMGSVFLFFCFFGLVSLVVAARRWGDQSVLAKKPLSCDAGCTLAGDGLAPSWSVTH